MNDNKAIARAIAMLKLEIDAKREQLQQLRKSFTGGEWSPGDRYEVNGTVYEIVSAPFNDDGSQSQWNFQVAKIKKDGTLSANTQYPYGIQKAVRVSK